MDHLLTIFTIRPYESSVLFPREKAATGRDTSIFLCCYEHYRIDCNGYATKTFSDSPTVVLDLRTGDSSIPTTIARFTTTPKLTPPTKEKLASPHLTQQFQTWDHPAQPTCLEYPCDGFFKTMHTTTTTVAYRVGLDDNKHLHGNINL